MISRGTGDRDYYLPVDLKSGWAVIKNKWEIPELIAYYSKSLDSAEEKANNHCSWLNNSL